MSEEFAVGKPITWIDSVFETEQMDPDLAARGVPGCHITLLTGVVKRITPCTVTISVDHHGQPRDHRLDKGTLANRVQSWELEQAILQSSTQADKPEDTRKHDVYILSDPRDGSIHYIGVSKNIQQRFKQHLTCSGMNLHKNMWVIRLLQQGLQPHIEVIDRAIGFQEAKQREAHWITYYRDQGEPLTNIEGVVS